MEAYRIDRFGSVDGIVLRSSEDPRPGLKEILMRVSYGDETDYAFHHEFTQAGRSLGFDCGS